MPIESRLQTENIRIQDLNLEQAELKAYLLFDPEKEISPEEKQKILAEFRRYHPSRGQVATDVTDMVLSVKTLFPSEYKASDMEETESNDAITKWIEHKSLAEEDRSDYHRWKNLLHRGANLKLIFPKQAELLKLDNAFLKALIEIVFAPDVDEDDKAADYLYLKILYPRGFDVPNDIYDYLTNSIKVFRENKNGGDELGSSALRASLLFPEKASEVTLYKSDFQLMKADLKRMNQNNSMVNFARLAMTMKLLQMENLQITEKGLTSLPKNKLNSTRPALPQIKKF